MIFSSVPGLERLRGYVRIMLILEAADRANLTPLAADALHSFAYLSNVLSPVWNLTPYEGTVYKRGAAPYYPVLQNYIDELVGRGLIEVSELAYVQDLDGRWRFAGSFNINRDLAKDALAEALSQPELAEVVRFLKELALALSALDPRSFPQIAMLDANYADPRASAENVVDFGDWNHKNYSAKAARAFEMLIPGPIRATRGEQLNLYVRHLNRLFLHARPS